MSKSQREINRLNDGWAEANSTILDLQIKLIEKQAEIDNLNQQLMHVCNVLSDLGYGGMDVVTAMNLLKFEGLT